MISCKMKALIGMAHSTVIKTGSFMWIFQPWTTLLRAAAEPWLEIWGGPVRPPQRVHMRFYGPDTIAGVLSAHFHLPLEMNC